MSANGPFLPFAALRRDVGSVTESGPNAHIAASRNLDPQRTLQDFILSVYRHVIELGLHGVALTAITGH
jgi:hypothetical protein